MCSSEDIEDIISRIVLVLQKGIAPSDHEPLEEIKRNLSELLADVDKLTAADSSRYEFHKIAEELKVKYVDSEFDFEVDEVLDKVIAEVELTLEKKEAEWKVANLSLGDKSRGSVHRWKEKTKYLPEYLSKATKDEVKKLDAEADEIIKVGKIEDVVFYFEKLNASEREECLRRLNVLI